MTIDPKFLTVIFPIFITIAGFCYMIKRSSERIKTVEDVIFLKKGGLNIMTNEACLEKKENIEKSIERESNVTAKALERLDVLNENVIIIMTHMDLKPKRVVQPKGSPVKVFKDMG